MRFLRRALVNLIADGIREADRHRDDAILAEQMLPAWDMLADLPDSLRPVDVSLPDPTKEQEK